MRQTRDVRMILDAHTWNGCSVSGRFSPYVEAIRKLKSYVRAPPDWSTTTENCVRTFSSRATTTILLCYVMLCMLCPSLWGEQGPPATREYSTDLPWTAAW